MTKEKIFAQMLTPVFAVATDFAAFKHGANFAPFIGLTFAVVAAITLGITFAAFKIKSRFEATGQVFSVFFLTLVFMFMAFPGIVIPNFGDQYQSSLEEYKQYRAHMYSLTETQMNFVRDNRFQMLTIHEGDDEPLIDVTGRVESEKDLVDARNELVNAGLCVIQWDVQIEETETHVQGYGDAALFKSLKKL